LFVPLIRKINDDIVQGGGGGLEASKNVTSEKLGANILLAGLVAQTLSFALFMVLVAYAWRGILRDGFVPSQEPWGPILWILMFSSTAYLVRFSLTSLSILTDVARYRFVVFIVSSSLVKVTAAIFLHMKVSVGDTKTKALGLTFA
jgi:hypothetical protein